MSHRRAAELLRTNQALVCSFFLCTCIARQYPIPFRWGTFSLGSVKKKYRCPEIHPIVHCLCLLIQRASAKNTRGKNGRNPKRICVDSQIRPCQQKREEIIALPKPLSNRGLSMNRHKSRVIVCLAPCAFNYRHLLPLPLHLLPRHLILEAPKSLPTSSPCR